MQGTRPKLAIWWGQNVFKIHIFITFWSNQAFIWLVYSIGGLRFESILVSLIYQQQRMELSLLMQMCNPSMQFNLCLSLTENTTIIIRNLELNLPSFIFEQLMSKWAIFCKDKDGMLGNSRMVNKFTNAGWMMGAVGSFAIYYAITTA